MVPELAEVCKAQSKPLNVQIKLETGMHRIGVEPGEELAALIGELKAAQEWVHVTGAFSHFAWPGNAEVCEAQYKKLLAGAEQLKAAGIPVPMCHISASESSELFPQYALDAVRIGRRLYMDHPKKPLGNIQEVVSWRSYLTNVKQRRAGDSLAYFGKYVLDKDTVVATVGVGYGDGLNEKLVACHAAGARGRQALPVAGVLHGPVLRGCHRCRGCQGRRRDHLLRLRQRRQLPLLSGNGEPHRRRRGLRPDLRADAPRRPRIPLISARRVPYVPVNGFFCIHRCIIFDITV